jgi:hypothetical protein
MAAPIDPELLHGRWLRAREEGAPDEAVYRPAAHAARAARGLEGIELRADGSAARITPAETDVSRVQSGNWQIDDDTLSIVFADPGSAPLRMTVLEASADRLVLKK